MPLNHKTSKRDALPRVGWAGEVGGRFSEETASFLRGLAAAKVRDVPRVVAGTRPRSCVGGVPCWPVLQRVLSRSPFMTGTVLQGWMVLRLPSEGCWEILATSCEPLRSSFWSA